MKLTSNLKILIVGLGLIGGSYAKILTSKGYEVGAVTLNQQDIDYAIENNIIKHGMVDVNKDYVSQFDVVIFALYPNDFIKWVSSYHNYFKKGAILSDVTGIKSSIVYKINELIKDDNVEFVAAHPMAGKEVYGVKNASFDLFKGANYIVTPVEHNSKEAIELVCDLANVLGFGKISLLTPQKHDEMIAYLSQLTHCIAISLMTCNDSTKLKDYTGDSFRDLTRIASINENMWSELFLSNKEELVKQMDLFIDEFNKLRQTIIDSDEKTMKELMKLSTKRRNYFNSK